MAQNINTNQVLSDIYFDPSNPASYSGLNVLYQAVKQHGISRKNVEEWLSKQQVYTIHRKVKRKFKRPKVISSYKNYIWDGDTINMVYYKDENDGYSYILLLIDIFTRFVWTAPLKTLRKEEMLKVLKGLLPKVKPDKLRTDHGGEFNNDLVKKYLKEMKIDYFTTTHELKANYAERANRSVKTRLTRFMYKNHTPKWLNTLPKVTKAYNNARHRTIKMTPTQALTADRFDLWNNQYMVKDPKPKKVRPKVPVKNVFNLKVNDRVRIQSSKSPFERAYTEKWSVEIYTIISRKVNQGLAMYNIKAWDNEEIKGSFYENEVQKVGATADIEYIIDEVIREEEKDKKKGYIVSWVGWPARYNSWVPAKDVKDRPFIDE